MMETEEKPAEEVSKMEEVVPEKPEPEKEIKEETTSDEAKKEEPVEPEVKMEIEETQMEDSSKVTAEVTMETEPAPAPIKEENPKVEESSQKDDGGEQKSVKGEDKVQEEMAKDKVEVDQEKEIVDDKNDDKVSDVKSSSTSPDPIEKEPVKATEELSDDFNILGTDDENDETKDKKRSGVWMPDVNVIIDLYQKLDKEGVLELQWKCPGRRPPPEEVDEKKEEAQKTENETEKPDVEEEKQEEEPTEFDFDIDTPSVTNMAPRRTPGSGQALGSSKKRVARMDKIFNDMLRHKRIDEELARAADESDESAANRTDTTPQRPVAKFRIRKDF
ncbi:PAXIP1-associated glutamate-rich protein 1-like [Patiria miniata]|uniref:Uncharacterized protein n=1 Tax=Patiria miniata TaxID=46514 RepID=A0A913ZQV8_PATMI|nr:PAXIP1-associated glutamate-rich protein 1-like [Patiria miniata]